MNDSNELGSGYALPFTVKVPRLGGFFSGQGIDIVVSLRVFGKQAPRRLERAVGVFAALAETGALSGGQIAPGRCVFRARPVDRLDLMRFRFSVEESLIDDKAVMVLAHLLFTQRKWLAIDTVQVLVAGVSDMIAAGFHDDQITSYPGRWRQLPFQLNDEEPETEAVTFELEFERAPKTQTVDAINHGFSVWMDAVLRGGYSLAPLDPEDAHVETYDDQFTVIGNVMERSYHKLTADDAAIDAALNIFAAMHQREEPIRVVRIC